MHFFCWGGGVGWAGVHEVLGWVGWFLKRNTFLFIYFKIDLLCKYNICSIRTVTICHYILIIHIIYQLAS